MQFYGKAEEAAKGILDAFENPENLPAALAQIFVRRNDDLPCSKWSWSNQLLAAIFGGGDARGFRQWEEVGRRVRKGGKSFPILVPIVKSFMRENDKGEQEKFTRTVGFRHACVFGVDQTEGDPLPVSEDENFIKSLPLIEVAESWGISVSLFNGHENKPLGKIVGTCHIGLGVKNLSTWAHEMIHAADYRLGTLTESGQHWRSETVAELGGAVLLLCLGFEVEADLGGAWQYITAYAKKENRTALSCCVELLNRTCAAVAKILDEAATINDASMVAQ